MKISDILKASMIFLDLHAHDKTTMLRELSTCICKSNLDLHTDAETIFRLLLQREQLGSTGVGDGIAIPHAKISHLNHLIAAFARTRHGIPFESTDSQPVRLVFVLLVPENSAGLHLKALARISRLLKNNTFREKLLILSTAEDIYQSFNLADTNHDYLCEHVTK